MNLQQLIKDATCEQCLGQGSTGNRSIVSGFAVETVSKHTQKRCEICAGSGINPDFSYRPADET